MKIYNNKVITSANGIFGTGWLPPVPDFRDYTEDHVQIKPINKKLGGGFAA